MEQIRWMAAWNIYVASETKERALAKELVGPNLAAEAMPFTFPLEGGTEEVKKAPMAFVPDMISKVIQLLDQNEK